MQSWIRNGRVVKIFLVMFWVLPLLLTAGENILNNPSFKLGADGLPIDWNQSYAKLLGRINVGEENGGRLPESALQSARRLSKRSEAPNSAI